MPNNVTNLITESTATSLLEVLDKIEFIGLTTYNGKYEDNILNIFEELNPSERRVILMTMYNVVSMVKTPPDKHKKRVRFSSKPAMDEEEVSESFLGLSRMSTQQATAIVFIAIFAMIVLSLLWHAIDALISILIGPDKSKLFEIFTTIF